MSPPRSEGDPRQLKIRPPLLRDQKNRSILGGTVFDSRAISDQSLGEKSPGDRPAIRPDDFFRSIRKVARVDSEGQLPEPACTDSPMNRGTILLGGDDDFPRQLR